MKKANSTLFTLLLVLLTTTASASELALKARAYSSNQCGYYSANLADFTFTYKNELAWGSKVKVKYGFTGNSSPEWSTAGELELTASAPYTWESTLAGVTIANRGNFVYSNIEFVLEITNPDGSVWYEKGGTPTNGMGYLTAVLPNLECLPGEFKSLPITVINR